MDNLTYLVAAFAVIWALVFLYILYLARRQKALHQDLQSLEDRLRDLKLKE
jgi:CcmD family protein